MSLRSESFIFHSSLFIKKPRSFCEGFFSIRIRIQYWNLLSFPYYFSFVPHIYHVTLYMSGSFCLARASWSEVYFV